MDPKQASKLVNRLLAFPEGRKALGVVDTPPEPVKRKRVALLVPSYKQAHPMMQESTTAMMAYSREFVDVFMPPRTSSSVIHWSRNSMVAQLELSGEHYDYVLFVDDDMVVKPDFLMRLLEHEKPIMGGICTKRTDPPMPTIRHLDKNMTYGVIVKWDNTQRLMEVDGVGTGFMLISRGALQAIGEYYLRCGYERQTFGRMFNAAVNPACSGEGDEIDGVVTRFEAELATVEQGRRDHRRKTGNEWWFQFLPSLVQEGELGEDISFCLKAKLIGLPIFVDTTVTPGHIGDYVYTVDDFFQYQQECLQGAAR